MPIRKSIIILSLFGLLTSIATWSASYGHVGWSNQRHMVIASYGQLFAAQHVQVDTGPWRWFPWRFRGWETRWRPKGDWSPTIRVVAIPLWIPVSLCFATLMISTQPVFKRRQRRRRGQCAHCGYDLTGNVSGACSECGRTVFVEPNPPPTE